MPTLWLHVEAAWGVLFVSLLVYLSWVSFFFSFFPFASLLFLFFFIFKGFLSFILVFLSLSSVFSFNILSSLFFFLRSSSFSLFPCLLSLLLHFLCDTYITHTYTHMPVYVQKIYICLYMYKRDLRIYQCFNLNNNMHGHITVTLNRIVLRKSKQNWLQIY